MVLGGEDRSFAWKIKFIKQLLHSWPKGFNLIWAGKRFQNQITLSVEELKLVWIKVSDNSHNWFSLSLKFFLWPRVEKSFLYPKSLRNDNVYLTRVQTAPIGICFILIFLLNIIQTYFKNLSPLKINKFNITF